MLPQPQRNTCFTWYARLPSNKIILGDGEGQNIIRDPAIRAYPKHY
jgi:hypothetical protein